MKRMTLTAMVCLCLVSGLPLLAQENQTQQSKEPPKALYVRVTVYPTASLSRYDYNNDIDLYEIRAYVELRSESQTGEVIQDADIHVLSQPLEFRNFNYEKRIKVSKDELPGEFDIEISLPDGRNVKEKFSIPAWLILIEPKPAVVDTSGDLVISWKYSQFSAPVDVRAYNFKTGDLIVGEDELAGSEMSIPGAKLPGSTIIRVYVIQSWLYKHYLRENIYARGSEVNVIPWSQVFIRTR